MDNTQKRRAVNMTLPPEMLDQMHALAAYHRRTFSGEVEWALSLYLSQQEKLMEPGGLYAAAAQDSVGTQIKEEGSREP